jgi:prevent-host-death family protein
LNQQCAFPAADDYNDYHSQIALEGNYAMESWTVAQAKAKLSVVIERARAEGPQTITRRGRNAAVVVSAEEWERKTKRSGNLAEFFAESPLRGADVQFERVKDGPREVEL